VPRHDRTSTINFVANINVNNLFGEIYDKTSEAGSSKWLVGINFIYATGQPITIPTSVYAAQRLPDWSDNQYGVSLYPSELNTLRLPPYIRLDISITYEKQYDGWSLAPYLQIFNVGNRKNVWFIDYNNEIKENQIKQEIKTINMLPIVPSVGVNIKF
jgi:hypothetical protein